MSLRVVWCDDFVRLDPQNALAMDNDGEQALLPPVRISGLRGAFASFQLSVGPVAAGQTVKVQGGSLKGKGKAAIAASQYDVFVEWYVPADGKWYPDACVPQNVSGGSTPSFRKLNAVEKQQYVGFWVDMFVPEAAKPGDYTGKVTVIAGGEKLDVPVTLSVAAAKLGPDCCLDVSMNNYADAISGGWKGLSDDPDRFFKPKYQRVEQGVFKAAHEHRAFLHYVSFGHSGYTMPSFAPPLEGEGPRKHVSSWTEWDKHFGKYFDGSAFKGTRRGAVPTKRFYMPFNLCWPGDFVKFGQPGYEAEWRAVGADIVKHFKAKGWTKTSFDMFLNHKQRFRFFPWDTEEARFPADNDVNRYIASIWKGTFDHATTKPVRFDFTLGTTWLYHEDIRSDLVNFIDVFIGGAGGLRDDYDQNARLHKLGRQILPCISSGSLLNSTRAPAFSPLMIWMLDGDGFMPRWFSMDGWGEGAWRGSSSEKGAGTFLYCGSILGSEDTFGSLRMKVMRNSLQMMDAFQLAADRIPGGKNKVRSAINKTLGIPFSGWFSVKRPDPKDTSQFTEEPPAAGWEKFTVAQNRSLRELAANLASGGK